MNNNNLFCDEFLCEDDLCDPVPMSNPISPDPGLPDEPNDLVYLTIHYKNMVYFYEHCVDEHKKLVAYIRYYFEEEYERIDITIRELKYFMANDRVVFNVLPIQSMEEKSNAECLIQQTLLNFNNFLKNLHVNRDCVLVNRL